MRSTSACFKDLAFDPVADFAPVSLVASHAQYPGGPPLDAGENVKEVIALAKAKPGTLNFASAGMGSSSHLAGSSFASSRASEIVHVPYKGAGPAMVDVLSGQVQLYFATMPAAMPHVEAGEARAGRGHERASLAGLPDLPTVRGVGRAGYEASTWYGVLAPAHTSPAVVARLHETL